MSFLVNMILISAIATIAFSGLPASLPVAVLAASVFVFFSYKRFLEKIERNKQLTQAREEAFLAMYSASRDRAHGLRDAASRFDVISETA